MYRINNIRKGVKGMLKVIVHSIRKGKTTHYMERYQLVWVRKYMNNWEKFTSEDKDVKRI